MKSPQSIAKRDLVLIGGGHSHVAVIKAFAMNAMPDVRLTVIARDVNTPYSGMLPGYVAGHYTFDEAHVDLRPLCRLADARLYHDRAVGLDPVRKLVLCEGRPPVPYDLLSVDIGSTPKLDEIEGAAEFSTPVKPINRFVDKWSALMTRALAHAGPLRLAVVGAGAAGVEMTLAMQYRLRGMLHAAGRDPNLLECHLFVRGARILPAFPVGVAARFNRVMAERGVRVHSNADVTALTEDAVICADGSRHAMDETLVVTGATAQPWLAAAGLTCEDDGFVRVDACLRSVSHPDIFAAGDVANVVGHRREKAGVFAVRQGPVLADNLRRVLRGSAPKPYRPQSTYLALISTGDKYAVAHKAGVSVEGAWVWRWKDWIDRRWMAGYGEELPAMPTAPAEEMRCGGCGAKVGPEALSAALSGIASVSAPEDAAVIDVPPDKTLVQSVDFFRAPIDDPYLFGKIAANHALGDIFAMGGEPHTALAIASVPYDASANMRTTLSQMMAGAEDVLHAAGAKLVGGHSSEGAELALGFSVNGLVAPQSVRGKRGAQEGDVLILTKPLGTGTLMAADMRAKARGKWIEAALATMLQSNGPAARILCTQGAHAMTDVTGFGLAGHVLEMLGDTLCADIDIARLPVLDGALETIAAGIVSSLHGENATAAQRISAQGSILSDPRFALLFDPQTAGGLLAAVPATGAEVALGALRKAGFDHAAIIGKVCERAENAPEFAVKCVSHGYV